MFKVEAELRQLGISEEQKDTRSTTVSDATLQQFADALGKLNLNAKTACDFIISAYNDMPEIQDELITKYKAATDEGKYVFGSIDEATLTNCKKLFSKYKLTDARVANTLLDYFAKLIKPAANATDGSKK